MGNEGDFCFVPTLIELERKPLYNSLKCKYLNEIKNIQLSSWKLPTGLCLCYIWSYTPSPDNFYQTSWNITLQSFLLFSWSTALGIIFYQSVLWGGGGNMSYIHISVGINPLLMMKPECDICPLVICVDYLYWCKYCII